jgi:Tol biopolymer transport system component
VKILNPKTEGTPVPDFEDRLRRGLHALAPEIDAHGALDRVQDRRVHRQRVRRGTYVAAVLCVVLLGGGLAAALTGRGHAKLTTTAGAPHPGMSEAPDTTSVAPVTTVGPAASPNATGANSSGGRANSKDRVSAAHSPTPSTTPQPHRRGGIAFVDADGKLYVMNPDGSDKVLLATPQATSYGYSGVGAPVWSADGTTVAFVSQTSYPNPVSQQCKGEVDMVSADGGPVRKVMDLTYCNYTMAISLDGHQVALGSFDGIDYLIQVVNSDGSGLHDLLKPGCSDDEHPTWSPDGTRIMFSSNRDANGAATTPSGQCAGNSSHLFTINPDGSNLTMLDAFSQAYSPSWSRDGSKVVFMSNRTGHQAVYTANIDGSNIKRVPSTIPDGNCDTSNTVCVGDVDFSWSLDGTRLVFLSGPDSSHEDLYVIDADGQNRTRLTNSPDSKGAPAWG